MATRPGSSPRQGETGLGDEGDREEGNEEKVSGTWKKSGQD